MKIDLIEIRNFRCFEEAAFQFAPRFTLIIGDNARGKTAILDSLSIGMGGLLLNLPKPAKSRRIHRDEVRLSFFAHGDSFTSEQQYPVQVTCSGEVAGQRGGWRRELASADGRTTRQDLAWIRPIADGLRNRVAKGDETVVLPLLSYYGTGRLWVQRRQQEVDTKPRSTRFMGYSQCLNPASDEKGLIEWFKTNEISAIQKKQPNVTLEACRHAILACVPDAKWVFFDVARDELILRVGESELPFHYLSDGFRNVVAMAADIAVRCSTLNPQLGSAAPTETPGIVLIDEIDLHLHPRWQRRVITDFLSAFRSIQFIVTTHSPFIIQSLPPQEGVDLINLDNAAADDFVDKSIEDITEDVQGVSIPQRSRRYLEMMETAEEYYRLLRNAEDASSEEREALRQRLDELSLPFSNDPAYQALLRSQRNAAGVDKEGN